MRPRSLALPIALLGALSLLVACDAGDGSRVRSLARELLRFAAPPEPAPASGKAAGSPHTERSTERAQDADPPGAAPLASAPAAGGKRVYYQFVDESGAVRFVENLSEVPEAQRAGAGRIEIDPRELQRVRAPRAPPERRPFAYEPASPPRVVVYTAPWCGWCRRTLQHLDQKRVRYENKDIEANPAHRRELLEKTGRTTIPVIEINGQRVDGYNPRRIDQLLAGSG